MSANIAGMLAVGAGGAALVITRIAGESVNRVVLNIGLACWAVAAALRMPMVAASVGTIGWAAPMVGALAYLVGAWSVVVVIGREQVPGSSVHRRTVIHTSVLMVCVLVTTALLDGALFAATPAETERTMGTVVATIVQCGYFTAALVAFTPFAYRHARRPEAGSAVRWGLRIAGVGVVCGALHVALVATWVLGLVPAAYAHGWSSSFFAAAVGCFASGMTAPAWLPPVLVLAWRIRTWHAVRCLDPMRVRLNADASRTVRAGVLAYDRESESIAQLSQTVIAILDRIQVLKRYAHPEARRRVEQLAEEQGLDHRRLEVFVEAAELITALIGQHTPAAAPVALADDSAVARRDRRRHRRRATDPRPAAHQIPDVFAVYRNLRELDNAMRYSETVNTVVRELAAGSSVDRAPGAEAVLAVHPQPSPVLDATA